MNKILDYALVVIEYVLKLYFSKFQFIRQKYTGHWEEWETVITIPVINKTFKRNIWFFKKNDEEKPFPFCTTKLQSENW